MLSIKIKSKIIVVAILALVALILTGIWFCQYQKLNAAFDVRLANGSIESTNSVKLKNQLQKEVDDSSVQIQLNTEPRFSLNGKSEDIFIANSFSNKDNMVVSICRKDNGDCIFKSDVIRPGKTLSSLMLTTKLESGEYGAIAKIEFQNESGKTESENIVDMVLHVEG